MNYVKLPQSACPQQSRVTLIPRCLWLLDLVSPASSHATLAHATLCPGVLTTVTTARCLVDTSVDGAEFTKRLTESLGDGECECHTDIGPQLDPWVSFPPTLLGAHSHPASPTPPPQLPVTARECSSQSSTYRVCK